MGRAGPPPPPPPNPFSSDPLPHSTSFPSSDPQPPSSDLVRSGPDLTVFSSSAGQSNSGHDVLCQPPYQQASAPPSAAGFLSSKPQSPPSDLVRSGPILAAISSSAGQSSSGHDVLSQTLCQQAPAPFAAAGYSNGISAQPLNILPAIPASDLSAAGPDLAAAGSISGHINSGQALPLQPARQPAPSSLRSSCPPSDQAAAGPISATFRDPSTSDFSHHQIASVLPLLASVLQQPPATSFAITSSSSLPSTSQSATLLPPSSGTSMACSKEPLDTPLFSAPAQISAPIGSTPGVRFNVSTKNSSAIPFNHTPPTHPPTPLSYAQAARQSRGSGFVRTHAADVESFARLPRTGANIICGSKEGIPSFSIVNSDLRTVENLFSNALIMKFQGGRPSLEVSHREIQSWGLEHPFSIGPLSSRAFLLRFQANQDLIRVLTRPSSILITFPYKVFRWHNLCHLKDDSCYAPVWISLPRLPLQCFIPEFLESVANRIGRFLCFDKATTTLARPSAARLCVELDLRITPPPFIWVGLFDGLKQPIIYEKMPKYCGDCHIQGHLVSACPKGHRETPNVQAVPFSVSSRARPPPARQNAVQRVSAPLHQPNTLAAPSSTSQHPTPPDHPSISIPSPSPLLNAEATRQQPMAAAHKSVPSPPLLPDADEARLQHSPLHQPTYLQVQPTVSLLQRPLDASTSSDVHLQAQSTASLQQHNHQTQPTAGLLQQAAAAGGPAAQAQPTDTLLQRDPAAAALSAGLYPLRHSSSLMQQASVSAAPSAEPSANLDPPLQSASPAQRVSASAEPSFPPADPSMISAHSSGLRDSTMTQPSPPHKSSTLHKGKQKSIKTRPPDVGTSSSLNQQQQEALELFKSKVLGQSRIRELQPSVNHFEALRFDHSDADGEEASYYSDTDDGCAEHIELGYQSANGRSSNKHKDFIPSGMRTNKRHPNMPLRVKLRSRKNSHPSSP